MQQPIIEVSNISKHYSLTLTFLDRFSSNVKAIRALNGVSLSIFKGETMGLVGESGCGKSTLGRIILGLEEPNEGTVRFKGKPINQHVTAPDQKELRKKMAVVFQNPGSTLDPKMTVRAILQEPFRIHTQLSGAELDTRISQLLELVGLDPVDARKYPVEFSDGQKQRIAFVRALALDPEFIVADEPVSALDVSVQAQILNLVKKIQRDMDLSILFISHDLNVVRFVSDRIAVIYLGKIMEIGPTEDFFESHRHPYSEGLLSSNLDLTPEMNSDNFRIVADVPVSQVDIPKGCVFHLKCPEATDKCKTLEPDMTRVSKGHFVRCWLF